MAGPMDGFERRTFTFEGKTREVYRTGSGPAVIVIAEIPGITPKVAEFGRRVADIGCTAVLPRLFGEREQQMARAELARIEPLAAAAPPS